MKKRIIWGYVIFIHMFLGLILLKSNFIQRVKEKLGIDAPQSEITENFHQMLSFHSRMDGNVPDRSVIFIGDSGIQGLAVSAVANPSVNYGIGCDTTVGVLQRLPAYKSINRARAVVISIGGNDMKYRSDEEILCNLKAMNDMMPHNLPVVYCAILPRDEDIRDVSQGINNRIRNLNSKLKGWTGTSEKLSFADPVPQLMDEKGNLADEFHVGDGVHLNSRGNAIWIQHLKRAVDHTGKRQ